MFSSPSQATMKKMNKMGIQVYHHKTLNIQILSMFHGIYCTRDGYVIVI